MAIDNLQPTDYYSNIMVCKMFEWFLRVEFGFEYNMSHTDLFIERERDGGIIRNLL